MKNIEFQTSDEIAARLEELARTRGSDYASVSTEGLSGRDALLTDLIVMGLDEISAGEDEFPDDVED